jgi:hypothetical protein
VETLPGPCRAATLCDMDRRNDSAYRARAQFRTKKDWNYPVPNLLPNFADYQENLVIHLRQPTHEEAIECAIKRTPAYRLGSLALAESDLSKGRYPAIWRGFLERVRKEYRAIMQECRGESP